MAVSQFNPNPGLELRPFTRYHGRRTSGGASPILDAWEWNQKPFDAYWRVDDFDGTINSVYWTLTNTGAASAAPVFNAQQNGAMRFVTGGGNPGVSVAYGPNAIFGSDDNPYFGIRFKAPAALTNFCLEVGLANIRTTPTTQSVSDVDVPTVANGLTDGAVVVLDTSQTLQTAALVGVGTSIAVAKTNIGTWTPTASKWHEIHLHVRVGVAYVTVIDSVSNGQGTIVGRFAVASGPDTAKLLLPYIMFKDFGTSKTADVDVAVLTAERNLAA